MQVDWKEDVLVQIGGYGRWVKIQALCFSLSFSRKMVVRISGTKSINAFLSGHQAAFRRFGGIPQYIRPDCLRSAIVKWRGERSVVNERYKKYMNDLGIEIFPSRPGTPTDKGKIEKRIGDLFRRIDLRRHLFENLGEVQAYIDQELEKLEGKWSCGAIGLGVGESYEYERRYLKPLPEIFPELPLKEVRTTVRRDGTVYFDENYYQVPQVYRDKSVLCIHTGQEIRIYHSGEEIVRYEYLPGTKGMVRLTEKALNDGILQLSNRVRGWAVEVAQRQVEIYEELMTGRFV